jgi:hypothetical protein
MRILELRSLWRSSRSMATLKGSIGKKEVLQAMIVPSDNTLVQIPAP